MAYSELDMNSLELKKEFESYISHNEENGCWEWTGTVYDSIRFRGKAALKIAYNLFIDSEETFSNGKRIKQTCKNKLCVNPEHISYDKTPKKETELKERPSHIPYGYCCCGCGEKTKLHAKDIKNQGIEKGEPQLFIKGHYNRKFKNAEEKFRSMFVEGDADNCWEWKHDNMMFSFKTDSYNATKFSYQLYTGIVPAKARRVKQTCQNKKCVNPKHLKYEEIVEKTIDMDKAPSNIPYGHCWCGCGQKTRIPTKNEKRRGHVKGVPLRYVSGHNRNGLGPDNNKGEKSLAANFPELLKEWDYEKNSIFPENFTPGSKIKVWWKCSVNQKHSWEASIKTRSSKNNPRGCPYCAGKQVLKEESLGAKYPKLLEKFSSKNNADLYNVSPGTSRVFIWECKCGNEWKKEVRQESTQTKIYALQGMPCPKCSSFLSKYPELEKYWDYEKNHLDPFTITSGSSIKVWWKCKHGHNTNNTIIQQTEVYPDFACSVCSGRVVTEDNNLLTMYPDIAAEWDYEKNDFSPTEIYGRSSKRAFWKCKDNPEEHKWDIPISSRTVYNYGCPICARLNTAEALKLWGKNNIEKITKCKNKKEIYCLLIETNTLKVLINNNKIENLFLENLKIKDFINFIKGEEDSKITEFFEKERPPISKELRKKLYKRDEYKCQNPYCSTHPDETDKAILTLDHKKPFIFGGEDTEDNLHVLCRSCNSTKNSKYWEEFLEWCRTQSIYK